MILINQLVKDNLIGKKWKKIKIAVVFEAKIEEEKGVPEEKTVGWHHRLNVHESEQTLGDSEAQGSLARCSPWDRKESDTTEQLNNNQIQNINS